MKSDLRSLESLAYFKIYFKIFFKKLKKKKSHAPTYIIFAKTFRIQTFTSLASALLTCTYKNAAEYFAAIKKESKWKPQAIPDNY